MKRQFYNLVDQDADLSGTVELRIHGMGGQTPEEMCTAALEVRGRALTTHRRRLLVATG